MKIKKITNRIYNDYFMKNRYSEYQLLIKTLLGNEYKFVTIKDNKELLSNEKHVIIRHDIDSDVRIAKKMFEIEKKYNVHSTYYFRTCTFNKSLIQKINEYGSEVGYHFEEIATFVKKNKLKSKEDIIKNMDKIQELFSQNIESFEKNFNVKLSSIASHGDFINRKYQISNNYLFDEKTRKKFPNIIEAYDKEIESNLDSRISDTVYPQFWKPQNPFDEIKEGKKNILILVHTRWWDRAPKQRLKGDFKRLIDEIKYKYYK